MRLYFLTLVLVLVGNYSHSQVKFAGHSPYKDTIFHSAYYVFEIDEKLLDKAIAQTHDQEKLFRLYYCKSLHECVKGNLPKALDYSKKTEKFSNAPKVKPGMVAMMYYNRTLIYQFQQLEGEKVLELSLKADSLSLLDFYAGDFACIRSQVIEQYRIKGKLNLAYSWIKDSEKIFKAKGEPIDDQIFLLKASVLNQLGDKAHDKSKYTQALVALEEFKKSGNRYNTRTYRARALAEMGVSYSNLGQSEKAIQLYMEAKELNMETGQIDNVKMQELNIFHEYAKLKDHKKVITMGEDLLTSVNWSIFPNRKIEVYKALGNAYEATNNTAKANYYLRKYIAGQEIVLKDRYDKDIDELNIKYRTTQKDQKIKEITRERELSQKIQAEKESKLQYFIIGLIASLILLTIAIVYVIQFRLAKKRIELQSLELSKSNDQLAIEVKQKQFLFRELHHRVKNNFQLIISFLQLQHNVIGNKTSEIFIENVELKMNAMSLVHEMLYREGGSEVIQLNEYISELISSVFGMVADNPYDEESHVKGSAISLSIEKAIPLGLVINELVTNSIKYAAVAELEVNVELQDSSDFFVLQYSDNGVGFPNDFQPDKTSSLGTRAVLLLMDQINAKVAWGNKDGAQWVFTIPKD